MMKTPLPKDSLDRQKKEKKTLSINGTVPLENNSWNRSRLEDDTDTPITDRLLALSQHDADSFHALPMSAGRSIVESRLSHKFRAIFGANLLSHDLTYTGEIFDTPILPKGICELSRRQSAHAFDAKYTAMVTSGTSVSNQIVIRGFVTPGCKVLADRTCHQSIHLALSNSGSRITYGRVRHRDFNTGRQAIDMPAFIEEYRKAAEEGDPYNVVILNGCSYEGVFLDIQCVFRTFLEIQDNVTFIVDEAWYAFASFHPSYRPFTAMYAANQLSKRYPKTRFRVFTTQSAHKSLSALRQGSFIHLFGDQRDIETLRIAQCTVHTTSPSYLILASLELARAQAALEGEGLITAALNRSTRIRQEIDSDPRLSGYFINESSEFLDQWTKIDPLRISVNCSRVCEDPKALKAWLFDHARVYLNHTTSNSVLLNIHIGISDDAIGRLLDGLRAFALKNTDSIVVDADNAVSDAYVIPYPPGVPLAVPGDIISRQLRLEERRLTRSGIEVFSIRPSNNNGFNNRKE